MNMDIECMIKCTVCSLINGPMKHVRDSLWIFLNIIYTEALSLNFWLPENHSGLNITQSFCCFTSPCWGLAPWSVYMSQRENSLNSTESFYAKRLFCWKPCPLNVFKRTWVCQWQNKAPPECGQGNRSVFCWLSHLAGPVPPQSKLDDVFHL